MKAKTSDKAINQGFEFSMELLKTAMSFADILSNIYQVRYTPKPMETRIFRSENKLDLVIWL
jgi:hypothetical protein